MKGGGEGDEAEGGREEGREMEGKEGGRREGRWRGRREGGGKGDGGEGGREEGEGCSHFLPSSEVVFQICGIAELSVDYDFWDSTMCLRMTHEHSQDR